MSNRTPVTEIRRAEKSLRSELDEIVRRGAQRMLQAALEAEVEDYVRRHREQVDGNDRRLVVRNGRMPERTVLTGAGGLEVSQPRVHDRREGVRFTSSILPPYLRRSPSLEALIPALYLKGVSTGDFAEALEAILGPNAAGLSANTVTRLKEEWATEYGQWGRRDLSGKRYVYWWADGIHFNVRLEEERTCILVIMGALEDGTKELIAVADGYRESELGWRDLMLDLKSRGLEEGPKLAVGDGALGFWAALREEFGDAREQRCWVHKTANILDSQAAARRAEPSEAATAGSGNMPKSVQPRAKQRIHDMYLAETKVEALAAYEQFMALCEAKFPKACTCLEKDREVLFAFYDFPAEHWRHIRTTNPIESTLATVRLRTRRTKGCGLRATILAMVYKLAREAERHWRRMNGHKLIAKVFEGVKFKDGIEQTEVAA